MVRAVGRDFHDLAAQTPDQRGILPHRVDDDDPVVGGKEHVDELTFGGKALAGARRAEVETVRVLLSRTVFATGKVFEF